MPEVTRVSRSYRERDRDEYSSDDDRSTYSRSHQGGEGYRTVQRYRITPSRTDDWDDRRSSNHAPRGERIEIDTRRTERFVEPERPRSAVDVRPRSTITERYSERDPIHESDRSRTTVYESTHNRDSDRRPWERQHKPWESDQNIRETDVRIEKRTTERREEPRRDDYEVERYQRETEYYDRPEPLPPIVIRQRPQEPQQIIVQEAPPPPPIILPRQEQNYEIIRREEVKQEIARPEPRREEEEYYRRDVREVGPRRDEDLVVSRYDRRDIRPRDSISDGGYSDGEEYVRTRRVIRTRSRSSSSHRKRHLAEGALAGAGAAAILASHRSKTGDAPVHRGRNVVGGAALGAIGAEVLTRARSRYRDSRGGRSRSRSRSSSRSKVKTGLGLAAAALATAAAVKYVQNRKANKEELVRGRSRTRSRSRRRRSSRGSYYSSSSDRGRSKSKHRDPKHRAASIAKAGAATAAVAGVVNHFRNKSRKRDGSRSKSRIRTGAEIVGSGLAGAAVAGLYENRKAKEEEKSEEAAHVKRERRRSRSRARSVGAYSDPGVDPELGMVQYGTEPVSVYQKTTTNYYDPALAAGGAGAGAAYGASRHDRSRSRRRRYSSDSDRGSRSRSRSRVRDIAGATAAAGAAAIGINQYKKRKEKKELQRERERRRYEEAPPENYYSREFDDYSPSPPHASGGSYHPEQPYYPPPPQQMPEMPPMHPAGFTQNINVSTPNVAQPPIPPYNPQDYTSQPGVNTYGYPPTARGPDNVSVNDNLPHQTSSPISGNTATSFPPHANRSTTADSIPFFPPPPTSPFPETTRDLDRAEEAHRITPPHSPSSASSSPESPHNKSVMFAPLSPTSSRRLARIHEDAVDNPDTIHSHLNEHAQPKSSQYDPPERDSSDTSDPHASYDCHHRSSGDKRRRRSRRNSDPSSDRPNELSKQRRRQSHHHQTRSPSPTSEDEVEFLPDRFDDDGRPLDRNGNRFARNRGMNLGGASGKGQTEMVERIVRDVGDVVEGKKTWKDLLKGFVDEAAAGSDISARDSGRSKKKRRG